jgi:hypothetical protein
MRLWTFESFIGSHAGDARWDERLLGKEEQIGSNPIIGSTPV